MNRAGRGSTLLVAVALCSSSAARHPGRSRSRCSPVPALPVPPLPRPSRLPTRPIVPESDPADLPEVPVPVPVPPAPVVPVHRFPRPPPHRRRGRRRPRLPLPRPRRLPRRPFLRRRLRRRPPSPSVSAPGPSAPTTRAPSVSTPAVAGNVAPQPPRPRPAGGHPPRRHPAGHRPPRPRPSSRGRRSPTPSPRWPAACRAQGRLIAAAFRDLGGSRLSATTEASATRAAGGRAVDGTAASPAPRDDAAPPPAATFTPPVVDGWGWFGASGAPAAAARPGGEAPTEGLWLAVAAAMGVLALVGLVALAARAAHGPVTDRAAPRRVRSVLDSTRAARTDWARPSPSSCSSACSRARSRSGSGASPGRAPARLAFHPGGTSPYDRRPARGAHVSDAAANRRRTIDDVLRDARARLDRLDPRRALAATRHGGLIVDIRSEAQRLEQGLVPGALVRAAQRAGVAGRSRLCAPRSAAGRRRRTPRADVRAGVPASLAAATLHEIGIRRATDMIGGFEAWVAAGLPVPRTTPRDELRHRSARALGARPSRSAARPGSAGMRNRPRMSLEMIDLAGVGPHDAVIDAGGGAPRPSRGHCWRAASPT